MSERSNERERGRGAPVNNREVREIEITIDRVAGEKGNVE